MRKFGFTLLTLFACFVSLHGRAQACKCSPPDLEKSYQQAESVVRVRITSRPFVQNMDRYYLAVVEEDAFKGCLEKQAQILIKTPSSAAACGVTFRLGAEYLVNARNAGRSFSRTVLQTISCSANSEWKALSDKDLAFLRSRYDCCGDDCACTDGSEPVLCFADPCQVSRCDVDGATCQANYCGGCNAEWHDETGARVCETNACDYADPSRRYISRSPAQCQLLRFACTGAAQAFSDACGCGCETQVACASSQGCPSGSYCTTEDGECQAPPGCGPGKICPAVCYGWCAPAASM